MNINDKTIINEAEIISKALFANGLNDIAPNQLHTAVSRSIIAQIAEMWKISREKQKKTRCAYYFSAEYLVGRAIFNNLLCLGLTDKIETILGEKGLSIKDLEKSEDAALGNGGLGRLAACFLDSAATLNLPLMGYGIRYKYGLFKQEIENGEQIEKIDDWTRGGDPWSIRRDDLAVTVGFGNQSVTAVAYDMPIIGYGTDNIGTLRLWQAEPTEPFDFMLFNEQQYDKALSDKNNAENISRVLYPNDTKKSGKTLRLKQQYFFTSSSLQDIIKRNKFTHGGIDKIEKYTTIQLNDTHPVLAIPEFIRIITETGITFDKALEMAKNIFNYTNHTVMQEALEKWDLILLASVCPTIVKLIKRINERFCQEMNAGGHEIKPTRCVIWDNTVHMAQLAVYATNTTNGVAAIHSQILKDDVFADWYAVYPDRFQNKTNGITQRRWLGLCNPELSALIGEKIGYGFMTDLFELNKLHAHIDDEMCQRFIAVKQTKKQQLAAEILRKEGVELPPHMIFDVQVKRMHEYKRQLMNALSIWAIYQMLKKNWLPDFTPTAFIFGAKAAPGYDRAKAVIHLINMMAEKINADESTNDRLRLVFVQNYNCSYAEKLMPAADISEQISPAGTEASGTGNMKLMLNGAVTLGTFDGANVEIVEQAGRENNYIFGATVDELNAIKGHYNPRDIYNNDEVLRDAMNVLVDGTFPDEDGALRELYHALLDGTHWHAPDHYFILKDFHSYMDAKMAANHDYKDSIAFARKCLKNVASAGKFSSDRTIKQYAEEIWHV